ncbi:uncharacterized protein LOC129580403 [Sitodiplosis mosellana]|uniref:uncharacterized protein LOC129580403 n=1 Tax=Sitodiplosis mosellana TaxID=263140 RepID=UPI002443C3CE|nr:uncharacterized protein LOC129580403 [Sitodiplosis mosellana]
MNHQYKYIVTVLVVFCEFAVGQNNGQNAAQKYCFKFEITQPTFGTNFRGCNNPKYDNFIVKDFNQNFKPFRTMNKQYLSNSHVNSCAALNQNFTFDQFTYIEASIFLKSLRTESIEIVVEDIEKKINYPLNYHGNFGWDIFNGRIQKNITNAQIKIMANNITPESGLAIEYFYVLNKANKAPECQNIHPALSNLWWIIICVMLGILLLVILAIGIYCIVNKRRSISNSSTDK